MSLDKTQQQIDAKRTVVKKAVRYILQTEIADRVWYQDKGSEEQLQKGLSGAEDKLTNYILERMSQI